MSTSSKPDSSQPLPRHIPATTSEGVILELIRGELQRRYPPPTSTPSFSLDTYILWVIVDASLPVPSDRGLQELEKEMALKLTKDDEDIRGLLQGLHIPHAAKVEWSHDRAYESRFGASFNWKELSDGTASTISYPIAFHYTSSPSALCHYKRGVSSCTIFEKNGNYLVFCIQVQGYISGYSDMIVFNGRKDRIEVRTGASGEFALKLTVDGVVTIIRTYGGDASDLEALCEVVRED